MQREDLCTPPPLQDCLFGSVSREPSREPGSLPGSPSPAGSPVGWRVLKLGVCAMDKKVKAPPMQAILQRLEATGDFHIVPFGDEMILGQPVEEWPVVDCLIAFFSSGFPLHKAEEYEALRKPFLVNGLREQRWLQDRRKMYAVMQQWGIEMPHHVVCSRERSDDPDFDWPVIGPDDFQEFDDHVVVGGVTVRKPFVEKPADADDHNVWIYFPSNAGGGVKKLFRKVKDKSAEFVPDGNSVRRDGSYIYESFVKSGGTDIKVYTVGPDYAHAEARKSPVVDGKVQRDADGKELRFPVLLSLQEKEMARTVVDAFNQNVCGLDILRTPHGKSYVIDVNGWAAVKKSTKYYDDCAHILHATCMAGCGMERHFHRTPPVQELPSPLSSPPQSRSSCPGQTPPIPRSRPAGEELRCVLIIARHGDRTPKQKMKFRCSYPQILNLHKRWAPSARVEAKLKSPTQLGEVLAAARELAEAALAARRRRMGSPLDHIEAARRHSDADEALGQLVLLQKVLKEGGHFSGINRKVQLKPTAWETRDGVVYPTEVLVVLKYGGVLTPAGRVQSEMLGREVRERMYPQSDGGGLLRLHSTFRHDLKIYCSDEGRVQISAAAFARGLLALEGALTPILVSMVHKDTRMLDDIPQSTGEDIASARKLLHSHILSKGTEHRSISFEGMPEDPFQLLLRVHECIEQLTAQLRELALSELQTLADSPGLAVSHRDFPPPEAESPKASPPPVLPDSPVVGEEGPVEYVKPGQRVPSTADVARLTEVMHNAGAEALAGELAGTGVPYHVTTAGKATMWTDEDGRAPPEEAASGGPSSPHRTPYGEESPTMMHMRWDRLERQLRNKDKDKWDLSKIPDVLDNIKYDLIHNSHMGLSGLRELYETSAKLAHGIVANEYGVEFERRLRVGATIMAPLIQKLLQDLTKACAPEAGRAWQTPGLEPQPPTVDAAVARALTTARRVRLGSSGRVGPRDRWQSAMGERVLPLERGRMAVHAHSCEPSPKSASSLQPSRIPNIADRDQSPVDERSRSSQLRFRNEEPIRLDPHAAPLSGVRSGSRSVVTRVYFTSESHIYGLMNVLRCAEEFSPTTDPERLVTSKAENHIRRCTGFDYLSHVVVRVFERSCPPGQQMGSDEQFRVEVEFSAGASDAEPRPDDRHPLPLRRRFRLSDSLRLSRLRQLLHVCTRSPPVLQGAWDDKESDGDNKEGFSVDYNGMKQHNHFRPFGTTDAAAAAK